MKSFLKTNGVALLTFCSLYPLIHFVFLDYSLQSGNLEVARLSYLCVQATSTPTERIFSKMNNVVSKKRNKITPAHTNETIFLSSIL